ncbi:hypothetical protein AB205_0093470 [Aquarana catesbeiana]|uniref:Uncharacterized protein n=1 Tax=Aquarana catesbeiana TaxID=8400 RepID=A0A2G9Q4U9_AQUCT|nr:hypothetical protein AB205_0093470 [Aquarana catesbeiana]
MYRRNTIRSRIPTDQEQQQTRFMSPSCGTTKNCDFGMTRQKQGNHFRPFPPPFHPPFPSTSTLPSTPAEASQEELGPLILDEVDAPSFSQDELSQEEAMPRGIEVEALPSGREEEAMAGPSRSLTECQMPPLRITTKRPRKMTRTEEESLALIREASQILSTLPNAEEAYGTYIATRLLELEKGQSLLCERLIFQAYQKGLRGELTPTTYIADEATPPATPPPPIPPPPPAPSTPPEAQPPRKAAEKRAGKAPWKSRR